jgi:hypothetical protein
MPRGYLMVTNKNLYFVLDGNIVKQISRAEITQVKAEKAGFSRAVFVYTKPFEATGFMMGSDDYKAIEQLLNITEIN